MWICTVHAQNVHKKTIEGDHLYLISFRKGDVTAVRTEDMPPEAETGSYVEIGTYGVLPKLQCVDMKRQDHQEADYGNNETDGTPGDHQVNDPQRSDTPAAAGK